MQPAKGSLQGDRFTPGNGMEPGMQKLNQNHISLGNHELNKKGNTAGPSLYADYPVSETNSTLADTLNLTMSNNNKFSQKETRQDAPPFDDILHELLQEQQLLNSCKVLDSSKQHSATSRPMSNNTGTVDRNFGVGRWQHAAASEPDQNQIVVGTVSRSTVHRSPQETEFNKRGLSKPCMWSNGETKIEIARKEQPYTAESPGQRLMKMLSQEYLESESHTHLHNTDQPSTSKETLRLNALGLNGTIKRSHDALMRSKSHGYKNFASDTEDQISWLEEQHSKLRDKRDGAMLRQRSQQEKRLISELKIAQNTIKSNKQAQSDTEDLSPDGRDDFREYLQNVRAVKQYHENIGTSTGLGFSDQTVRSPMNELEFSPDQHQTKENYSRHAKNNTQMLQRSQQLSSDRLSPKNGLRNGQMYFESTMSNGFDSPAVPIRGESSRNTMRQLHESNATNGQDTSNLDELERTLKMTLQSMSRSKISVTDVPQGFSNSDIRSVQNQKENGSINARLQTPVLDDSEEQEVVELKPIGHGVRILEPGSDVMVTSTSYPVQVVVSPTPLSPVTAYDNNGLSTVRRGMPSSASVPLSLSSTVTHAGSSIMSPTSTVSERGDNITFDLQQQQQAIKQQLLQQQMKQQQLQQQLQQLQQLQQEHQLIKQKLQEHRQQQQLIQQQQQQVEPHIQYQLMQQQQLFEQQLLQQQQQLLSLQQQLQQQQRVEQLQGESQQQLQQHHDRTIISEGNLPYPNESAVNTSMQKTMTRDQTVKPSKYLSTNPESEGRKNAQTVWQTSRLENSSAGFLQNSLQQNTVSYEQQRMQQSDVLTTEMEPYAERHQTLGRALSAQQSTTRSKQQSDFATHNGQQFSSMQRQQQMQQLLEQQQLPPHPMQLQKQQQENQLSLQHDQRQKLDRQMTAAVTTWSQGHTTEKETAEDVNEKAHAVVYVSDRGIQPSETVFGLRENRSCQPSYATQMQGVTRDKTVMEGLTVDTTPSFQTTIKSPSTSTDSIRNLLSSNQNVLSPRIHNTLQRTLSGPGSPNSVDSRDESIASQDLSDGMYQTPRFVRDNSQYWHKPNLTRDEAIAFLRDKPPGSFIIRSSNTFQGAYGLAIKVAQIPANIQPRSGDLEAELVRHFLIESSPKGVRLKGCSNEPMFGSLAALVYQHSITPLALPCKLILPELAEISDGDTVDAKPSGSVNSEGLIAAFNVLYISSTDQESLTGPEAVSRAIEKTFSSEKSSPTITEVHFKVTSVGITLTDNKRRLFFRRHYPFNTITHCGLDAKDRRWTVKDENEKSISTGRVFGFVARKFGSTTENSCHLFSELDSSQPACSIVNAVTKVIISGDSSAKS